MRRLWAGFIGGSAASALFSANTALTGCGFALAFGWLWFPVLRDMLLPGLFTGHAFRPLAFGLALGAGFLACGFGFQRLKSIAAERNFAKIFPAVLTHGLSLVLFGLACLALNRNVNWLPETLAGLAAALPGVWWTARLLSLGPGKAVAALAWAAGAACLVSLVPVSALAGLPVSPVFAACTLVAGLLLALGLACQLASSPALRDDTDAIPPTRSLNTADAVSLGAVGALFFSLGCLNVLSAANAPSDGGNLAPAVALVCGLALAAYILNHRGTGTPGLPESGVPVIVWPGVCALAVMALCLPFLARAAPILFGAGAGMVQATGLTLCAAVTANGRSNAARPAGLFLALTLAAVNCGYLASLELMLLAGEAGPAMAGLALAGLAALPFAAAYRKQAVQSAETASTPFELGPAELTAPPASAGEQPATPCPDITEELTDKEKTLTLLLVNGYSNKAVAEAMGLTENTVRWYIKKLNRKTGAASRAELITLLHGK